MGKQTAQAKKVYLKLR